MARVKMLGIKQVCKIVGLSQATVYRQIKKGKFPKGIRISDGRVAWHEEVVNDWCRAKISDCGHPADQQMDLAA